MSSNYQQPSPGPGAQQPQQPQKHQPTSELWGPWGQANERTQPQYVAADPQFTHREHVTGALPSHPSEAPLFRSTSAPYPSFPGYQPPGSGYLPQRPGYAPPQPPAFPGYQQQGQVFPHPGYVPAQPAYNSYPPYAYYPYGPYAWQPPQPKRDGYLLAVGISALVGSSMLLLGGLACLGFLGLFALVPRQNLSDSNYFASIALFVALTVAGLLGGGFGLYHSIRSVFLRKPSSDFTLPRFWIFVILYLVVVGAGFLLYKQGEAVTFPALTMVLIFLAGLFPALAVLALGVRRLHFPKSAAWPTSWRRFTLALLSGATLSVILAALLELGFGVLLIRGQAVNPLICADQPNVPGCQNPVIYNLLLIMLAVIAPVVEETVKPLAVVVLIGRVRSAAEAFVLGLACGIGFDLIETTGYISSGYNDWLNVALIRTGAGLLHGFGAAMVALGWYYLVYAKKRRLLLACACWLYAVLQHALWNGSWGLSLLPGPVGNFFNTATVTFGSFSLPDYEIVNIVEALFMLAFFIYMTGRLRTKTPSPSAPSAPSSAEQRDAQPIALLR